MQEIKIRDLMTKNVLSVKRRTRLKDLVTSMVENKVSCQVITENGAPVGIITERDLVRLLLPMAKDPSMLEHCAEDIMSSPIVTLAEHDSLYDAMVVSGAEKLRHLPITDKSGQLTGLVTQTDVAAAHFRVIELQADLIERAIKERTIDLEEANAELQALSMEDALMGVGNRRAMEVDLAHTHASSLRTQRPYCVALADVDYFKKYNDHYGHGAGDEALKLIAKTFADRMRKSDRIYRYGGEEVLLLLADTDKEGALIFMKRAIRALAALGIPHCDSPYGFLTTSAGIAPAVVDGVCLLRWQDVVEQADKALYHAKAANRNTVSLAA